MEYNFRQPFELFKLCFFEGFFNFFGPSGCLFLSAYYKLKFNQPSGTSGVEVTHTHIHTHTYTHLLETAKSRGSKTTWECFFFANMSFCNFSVYPSVYIFLSA